MRKTRAWGWLVLVLAGLVGCGGPGGEEPLPRTGGFENEARGAPSEQEAQAQGRVKPSGRPLWSWLPRGPDADALRAVATDRQGNVLAWGDFITALGDASGRVEGPEGYHTLLLVKYRPDGTRLWLRTFVSPGGSGLAKALTVDAEGNVLLAGFQDGGVDFGGGPLPPGSFVVKLDARGRHVWSRAYGLELGAFDIWGLATDESGNVAVAGGLNGTVDFGGGPVSAPSPFFYWGLLAKYGPGGAPRWVSLDTERPGSYFAVAVDSANQLYAVSGGIRGAPLVRRFSPRGEVAWTRRLEGTSGQGESIAVCGDRVVVTGIFSGSTVFAGRVLESAPVDFSSGFVAAWTTEGREKWAHRVGDWGLGVSADGRGDVVVTGQYTGGEDLGRGPEPGEASIPSLYVVKYDRNSGRMRWVRTFTTGPVRPAGIAAAKDGASSVVGFFSGPMDFGTGTVDPGGDNDELFLLHLAP